jgi:carbohydrate binding protein with CBM4/9 domain
MQLSLCSPAKKWAAAAAIIAAAAGYSAVAACRLLADHLAQSSDEVALQRAVRLDPGNAQHRYTLGIHQLKLQSPAAALPWLQSATLLNPHSAKYWIDLAAAEQLLGDSSGENAATNRALAVDPRSPGIAWQAANLFLAQGLVDDAMKQFRTVLENDPQLTWPALTIAWKIHPDVDSLLENVVPPAANAPFLQFLLSKHETSAAAKVWETMYSLEQPVRRDDLLTYERYLFTHQDVSQAYLVWQQAAKLSDIAAYQPSPENLLVNGDFSLEILNGGFDWIHQPVEGVSVALDPSETHSGSRSLRITMDGPGIANTGIAQMVAVEPNTRYDFSAFYKAKDMDGAGAMQFAVVDAYNATPLFMSEDLRDADFWKNAGGSFTTPAGTQLVSVQLLRVPPGRPIRGKLWIDGLRLVQSGTEQP